VRIFVTPLHPLVLQALRQRRDFDRLHALLIEYLRDVVAHNPGTRLRDFTELGSFGGNPDWFYDGAHMRAENAKLLVKALWAGGRD